MTSGRLEHYRALLFALKGIVSEAQGRTLAAEDTFFVSHANFLVKSFLICACSYLESYLKDIVADHIDHLSAKLSSAGIPNNLIVWRATPSPKKDDWKFADFSVCTAKDDIDDLLSANPHKTINTFKCIGIDIQQNVFFAANKGIVNAVVEKRNSVVHHNDSANDLSPGDILGQIDLFIGYIEEIDKAVMAAR